MNEPTLQNDEYAKLEIAIAQLFHKQVTVVGATLRVCDPNTGWYQHPGYLFNLCKVAKVLKENTISIVHQGGQWTASLGHVVHSSPHLEIAVWCALLEIEANKVQQPGTPI